MSPRPSAFGAIVVGGGVNGLAAAWQLARLGCPHVALVERFKLGHARGSSHGFSRITRTSYGDPLYVRLAQFAHAEEWPRLERAHGARLRTPTDGAFFGPAGGPFDSYAAAVADVGADVERLTPDEARRRFPLFRFPDAAGVLHDRTAAVVHAAETMQALTRQASVEGVHLLEETRVLGFEPAGDGVAVETDRGRLLGERLVLAAGAWAGSLLPALAPRLTVKRQSVGFYRVDAPSADLAPGRFPVWIHLGTRADDMHYGLPEFGREGLKAARHEVAGAADEPDDDPPPREETLAEVRAFVERQWNVRVHERVHAETCLYTNTANEDFVIDVVSDSPRIVAASICSGHGFKFGPLSGRLLAELALEGRTTVPAFESARARFAVAPATT